MKIGHVSEMVRYIKNENWPCFSNDKIHTMPPRMCACPDSPESVHRAPAVPELVVDRRPHPSEVAHTEEGGDYKRHLIR